MVGFITDDLNSRVTAPAPSDFEVARFIRLLKRQPYLRAYLA